MSKYWGFGNISGLQILKLRFRYVKMMLNRNLKAKVRAQDIVFQPLDTFFQSMPVRTGANYHQLYGN